MTRVQGEAEFLETCREVVLADGVQGFAQDSRTCEVRDRDAEGGRSLAAFQRLAEADPAAAVPGVAAVLLGELVQQHVVWGRDYAVRVGTERGVQVETRERVAFPSPEQEFETKKRLRKVGQPAQASERVCMGVKDGSGLPAFQRGHKQR